MKALEELTREIRENLPRLMGISEGCLFSMENESKKQNNNTMETEKIKTYQYWENNFDGDLDEYLGDTPCEIDEELFLYLAECVPPQYSSECFIQSGEASDKIDGVFYYTTCSSFDGKHYYLGILPEFKQ